MTMTLHPEIPDPAPAPPEAEAYELIRASEMCKLTRASYRQLDYWDRAGIIRPIVRAAGSGQIRWWERAQATQVRALTVVSKLSRSQLLRTIGRSKDRVGPWVAELDGVRVTVEIVSPDEGRAYER